MPHTSDALITSVLRKCFWDTSSQPITNAEILAIADEVIAGEVWPEIIGADYYVSSEDYTLESGYTRYRLPNRMFGPVRDVLIVDSAGGETSVPRMDLEDLGRRADVGGSTSGFHHYFDGDFLGLYPAPTSGSTSLTLRVRYFRMPSLLVVGTSATRINAIDLDTDVDTFTVLANAGGWTTGDELDVISTGNAYQVLAESRVLSGVSSLTFNFTATLVGSGIRSGDYVAAAGYTPLVQCPEHMYAWLVESVAAQCIAVEDPSEARNKQARAEKLGAIAKSTNKPRSIAEPHTLVARNSPYRRSMW